MTSRAAVAARTISVLVWFLTAAATHAAPLHFAVFGDTPYDDAHPGMETQSYLDMLQEIGRNEVHFVVHVGDFKSAGSPCSDTLFEQRRAEFDVSPHPF